MKHTPAPWQINHKNKDQICDSGVNNRGCAPIAHVIGSRYEKLANARLISSAPELLEALQEIVKSVDDGHSAILLKHVCKARAAIKKATGE